MSILFNFFSFFFLYNFTTQFSVSEDDLIALASMVDEMCDEYESTHTGSTCSQCGDYIIFARYSGNNANNSSSSSANSGLIAAAVLFPIILLAIGIGVWYLKRYDVDKQQSQTHVQQTTNLASTDHTNQIVTA